MSREILKDMVYELADEMKNVPFTQNIKTKRDQMLEDEQKRDPNVVKMLNW